MIEICVLQKHHTPNDQHLWVQGSSNLTQSQPALCGAIARFTDMEHRHVCGHVLPLLVDAMLGRVDCGRNQSERPGR